MAEPVTYADARAVLRDLELRQPVLEGIAQVLEAMMLDTQRLTTEVAEIVGVNASATALIRSLAEQLRAEAANDVAAQQTLNDAADQLDSAANDLGGAVAENPGPGGGGNGGGEEPPAEPTP